MALNTAELLRFSALACFRMGMSGWRLSRA